MGSCKKISREILGKKPLLLVFPISKDSTPKIKRKQKKNLILRKKDYII